MRIAEDPEVETPAGSGHQRPTFVVGEEKKWLTRILAHARGRLGQQQPAEAARCARSIHGQPPQNAHADLTMVCDDECAAQTCRVPRPFVMDLPV